MGWTDKTVAVTGAGGFIGSHLAELLLAAGARVRALVHGDARYCAGHLAQLYDAQSGVSRHERLDILGGDLRDASFVRRALEGAQTVYHLGAVTSVSYSYANPEETISTNTLGTLHVCEAARLAGCERLVHTSSAGVYGNALDNKPITEEHRVGGWNPYTAGKLGGDFTAQSYFLSYDLPVVTLRLFNVYGPRMGRYLIMPTIIEQLLQGAELRLGELTPTRTFTYISDVVRGFMTAGEAPGIEGETIHLGSERTVSMGELVSIIAQIMGVKPLMVQEARRLRPPRSEIYHIQVDNRKAHALLDWRAETNLEDGLDMTIAWFRQAYPPPTLDKRRSNDNENCC